MITVDGIVFSLQRFGGIPEYSLKLTHWLESMPGCLLLPVKRGTIYSDHLETVMAPKSWERRQTNWRPWERIAKVETPAKTRVFHSTYYRVPRDKSLPTVVVLHDLIHERLFPAHKRLPNAFLKRRAIARAHTIICISQATKKDLLELYPSESTGKEIQVIPHGVSIPSRLPAPTRTSSGRVLFVGSRAPYKNFRMAVEAVRRNQGLNLIIVGGGPLSVVEKEFLETRLPNRYEHLGYVFQHQLDALYNDIEMLLYPSSYEGFGLPLLDAMKHGVPIAAFNVSAVGEVLGDYPEIGQTVGVEEYTQLIAKLRNPKTARTCSEFGVMRVCNFDEKYTSEQTRHIFRKVLTLN